MAGARPATTERTFGYYRLEILAAVVNAVLLFGVAVYVLLEAWRASLNVRGAYLEVLGDGAGERAATSRATRNGSGRSNTDSTAPAAR
ncbi:MAG TPA: cation transporter [Kineosporiaceae bacterium]